MSPCQEFFSGELKVIRPLCYLQKKDITEFVSSLHLKIFDSLCPYAQDSKRQLIKNYLEEINKQFPTIKTNIFRALEKKNIRQDYLL